MKYNIASLYLCFVLAGCFGAKQTTSVNSPPSNEAEETTSQSLSIAEDNRKMSLNHRVFNNNDKLTIFLELDIPRLSKTEAIREIREFFSLNYGILPNYTSKEFVETKNIDLSQREIVFKNGKYYLNFDIEKKPILSAVLVIDLVDKKTGQKILPDILISYSVIRDREIYGLFDAKGNTPLFSSFLLNQDSVQIKDLLGSDKELIVSYYNQEFNPASPPMSSASNPTPQRLNVDSAFVVRTNTLYNFNRTGLYLIRSDTSQYYGLSFYVAERKYPKLSKVDDLVDPLIYITTKEEHSELKEAEETKKTMDKFWLKLMSGDVKKAKYTIRKYYQRVKMANDFFTSYKPGWQTDMGMILIIYGNPNKIIRNNDQEFWIYTQNASFAEIKFEFLRKPNQFTDFHYVLRRYPDYEQVWYPAIELWREGKVQ
ncbi:MAG: GWxTD domain-containing protein [Microscillaceae bacterium]|nr:GWxTD domain-containing protein [Microscillaceae bacterium]